ncbi:MULTISPECIES: hypothetical protein [Rodentibacter]|nr:MULTISPECIES: hypothetical protein [Rodentibacter]
MLEVISKDPIARRFAYVVVTLSFIFGMVWVLPNLINAIRWW